MCLFSVLETMSCIRSNNNLHLCRLFSVFLFLLVPTFGINLDGSILLSFKYSVVSDPLSVLDNWDYFDATPCSWTGVTCARVESPFGMPVMLRVISLVLPNSKLQGIIPENIGFLQHLRILDLSSNFLNGTLPSSLLNNPELEVLSLSNNAISGVIPEFIEGLKSLKLLNLSENALVGNVPKSLTSLENLTVVSLRNNYLSGSIPTGAQFFEFLDFSSNLLNGSLPPEFGGENLRYLNLSSNKISGLLPQEFALKIPANATIDLSFNNLSGEIPEVLSLSNQRTESYAGNTELCGEPLKRLCAIPSTLSTPPNVSENSTSPAIAAIPRAIDSTPLPNSPGTTLNPSQNPPQHGLKPGAIAGIAVGDLAGLGALAIVFLYIYHKKKKENAAPATQEGSVSTANAYEFKKDSDPKAIKETRNFPTWLCPSIKNVEEKSEATSSDSDENNNPIINLQLENQHHQHERIKIDQRSLVMVDNETELELETLLKASAYILGSSDASIVYKAVLQDGTAFAVRRIGKNGAERLKEFENQVKTIAKLRHQNLVRLRGFHWGDKEKLIIYDYVSNGSLANIDYRKNGSSPYYLPFKTRLRIAKGVARGLNHIHAKKHVHGNIRPSNILLTADMQPIISDFGLHWLIYDRQSCKTNGSPVRYGSQSSISSCEVNGSPHVTPVEFLGCRPPYRAPESVKNLKPSTKWDVYSFGILLLELLTGKVFSDQELNQWTVGSVNEDPDRVLRMADMAMRGTFARQEESMLSWFKLGFNCASLIPHKRPSMKDALHALENIPS